MTLATRCSACGTSFRVVQDQLKVSGGWVRCGRCSEVFNAIEGLYEVGSPMAEPSTRGAAAVDEPTAPARAPTPSPVAPAPSPPTTIASPPPPSMPVSEPAAATTVATTAAAAERDVDDRWPDLPPTAPGPEATPTPAEAPLDDLRIEPPRHDAEPDHRATLDALDSQPPSELLGSTLAPDADDLLVPSPADEWQPGDWPEREPTPSFLVAAERAARRRRPRSRWAWGLASLALTIGLVVQLMLGYRDAAASRWPTMRPALESACGVLGCTVEPLRHIAALSVEASGLQQVGNAPVYTLSVGLRNRSDVALMVPSLDLVLTDSAGRTIARRVLTMAELGRPSRTLAPGGEATGQATLSTGAQRVSGYTIEIFYP